MKFAPIMIKSERKIPYISQRTAPASISPNVPMESCSTSLVRQTLSACGNSPNVEQHAAAVPMMVINVSDIMKIARIVAISSAFKYAGIINYIITLVALHPKNEIVTAAQ